MSVWDWAQAIGAVSAYGEADGAKLLVGRYREELVDAAAALERAAWRLRDEHEAGQAAGEAMAAALRIRELLGEDHGTRRT